MGRTKTIEVSIRSLKTTYTKDDKWMEAHHLIFGPDIEFHPNYKVLEGDDSLLEKWFTSMDMDWKKQKDKILDLLEDIKKNGILDHIKIYRDGRINSGHKRVAIAKFLGIEIIRAEVVLDDLKL